MSHATYGGRLAKENLLHKNPIVFFEVLTRNKTKYDYGLTSSPHVANTPLDNRVFIKPKFFAFFTGFVSKAAMVKVEVQ